MFAGALIGGDKVPAARWLGAGIALSGLVVLVWPGGAVSLPLSGVALMTAAAVGWGLYSLRGRGGADPLATTAASFLLAGARGSADLGGAAGRDVLGRRSRWRLPRAR